MAQTCLLHTCATTTRVWLCLLRYVPRFLRRYDNHALNCGHHTAAIARIPPVTVRAMPNG